jgi:hypothetical protein
MSLANTVAAALSKGAAHGSWVAARQALAPLEPLTRLVALRRLRRLLRRAQELTLSADPSHELRVAALLAIKKRPESDVNDEVAIAAELEALGLGAVPQQKPWPTLGAVAAVALLVGVGFALEGIFAPFDPQRTPAGEALGEGIASYVVALGRPPERRAGALASARAKALNAQARAELGDGAFARLEQLLAGAERVANARGEATLNADRDAFFVAANDFGAELQKQRLPYFVDAEVLLQQDGALPLLLVSYTEREVELRFGERRVRALYLWRLDRLRVNWPALGYTRPRTPAALILLDQLEHDLVGYVLPALPEKESVELVDEQTRLRQEPLVAEIETRAAELLRRHYGKLLQDPDTIEVARLLARRRALLAKFQQNLSGQGRTLVPPRRLVPEYDYAEDLARRISRQNLREWDSLHETLLSPRLLESFEELRDRYALSVERHEAQHRLDFMQGFAPVPERLASSVGLENRLDAPEGSLGAGARHELSAYLAELADGPDSPLLALVLMSRIVLNRGTLGGPHSYAVAALLISLAEELGIDVSRLERRVEREALGRLMLAIGARPEQEIRRAADRCYAELFGAPLPKGEERQVSEHAKWRH